MKNKKAVLLLNDGTLIQGKGFGYTGTAVGELVFNTTMTGYQECLTDPSYGGQILLMTYPLIGNYGVNNIDFESDHVQPEGFVVRAASEFYSHSKSIENIDKYLEENKRPGIYDIDTRAIVRRIRSYGVMPSVLHVYEGEFEEAKLKEQLRLFEYSKVNFVEKVSTKKPLIFGDKTAKKTVVLIDYGVKMSIVRELVKRNIKVVVVNCLAKIDEIESYQPNGIVLSNGPGDPAILTEAHEIIRKLDKYAIFGICLGHQLMAHAFGGGTYKLKFGHRGANHPVLNKLTGKIGITTQNHGYAVDKMPKEFEVTHVHSNDGTVEGMKHKSKPIFSVQFHPEASAGPHDSNYLFDEFLKCL
ncbi:glutamine-hydrolyzing carbamoyl-phosphate synthase small subunit [Candidatus Micrarchaeota archaeon]|nr:glutamine-hydrolyzing carbamoyl-phosphate synthase small subunit [Candidatus Micrarchaeota archaeon]